MTPLLLIVLALATGSLIGSVADAGPIASWWLAAIGGALLIVSARLGIAGSPGTGVVPGLPAALVLGLGLGGAAGGLAAGGAGAAVSPGKTSCSPLSSAEGGIGFVSGGSSKFGPS